MAGSSDSKKLVLVIGATGGQGTAVIEKLLAPWGTSVNSVIHGRRCLLIVYISSVLEKFEQTDNLFMAGSSDSKKLVLVIGATGGQGTAVIEKLLAPSQDGTPSPYSVRGLTRDPRNYRAQRLVSLGVELVTGRFDDLDCVTSALNGAYGAWVNTDGFTVGELNEFWCGVRIFELAKQAGVRHFIWSNLDYTFKLSGYNPEYKCEHYDGKGRVADFLKTQSSYPDGVEMSWTIVTTVPYMDMLNFPMFGPVKQRSDGTVVFASPVGKGHVAMVSLNDLGIFARYCFDHRASTSGIDLPIASDVVDWEYLMATFEKVTGLKTELIHQSIDEWFNHLEGVDRPIANERPMGEGTTWKENFSAWWRVLRDNLVKRDLEYLRTINPNLQTLEDWMREARYGENLWTRMNTLKNVEEGKNISPKWSRIEQF